MNFKELNQLNGIEKLRRLAESDQRQGMAANLDYRVVNFGEGFVEYQYQLKERHINLNGTLHGGIMVTLLDTAMGAAAMSLLAPGENHTMSDISTKFIRPVSRYDDVLTVRAEVENAGRRTLATIGSIHNKKGKLVARAIGSAMKI
ncbi:MAG: PaaI family thioesterase [Cellvibrionaceae bacterium]|nr:PaaI family thioesterase [Cellvibrionaceae bacterium]MCV6627181.1 PaaI family thioesterase [Cellvibrionaceae bacterium]